MFDYSSAQASIMGCAMLALALTVPTVMKVISALISKIWLKLFTEKYLNIKSAKLSALL